MRKLPLPKITDVTELLEEGHSLDEAEKIHNNEMKAFDEVLEINRMNFDKDMRKMRACYYLQAFKQAVTFPFVISLPFNKHFSWCPHSEWFPEDVDILKKF